MVMVDGVGVADITTGTAEESNATLNGISASYGVTPASEETTTKDLPVQSLRYAVGVTKTNPTAKDLTYDVFVNTGTTTQTLPAQSLEYAVLSTHDYTRTYGTFTRASAATKDDGTSVSTNVPRFETTGMTIEESTTNLIQNPRVASDATYWAYEQGGTGAGTLTRVNDGPSADISWSMELDVTAAGSYCFMKHNYYSYAGASPFTQGASYTLSLWVKNVSGNTSFRVGICDTTQANVVMALQNVTIGSSWQRLVIPFTAASAGSSPVVYMYHTSGAIACMRITGLQLEASAYGTSYCDSSRANELLSLPIKALNKTAFTFEAVVTPHQCGDGKHIFTLHSGEGNRFDFKYNADGTLVWEYHTSGV